MDGRGNILKLSPEEIAAVKNPIGLFYFLWQEIDFDDHPLEGDHLPAPNGWVSYPQVEDGTVSFGDSRVIFTIGLEPDNLQKKYDKWYGEEGWELKPHYEGEGKDLRPHYMFVVSRHPVEFSSSALAANPKLHKWSLPVFWLKGENWFWPFNKFFQGMEDEDDFPAESIAGTVEMRYQLALWQERFSPYLPGWTWHLEIDNKIDRTGWYIRAPEESLSLYTIFLGYGWDPEKTVAAATASTSDSAATASTTDSATDSATDPTVATASTSDSAAAHESLEKAIRQTARCSLLKEKGLGVHGFLLFERAPLGELDRLDEAAKNELDVARTELMCGSRGSLTALARTEGARDDWAQQSEKIPLSLPGQVDLWPPTLGHWPLLVARSDVELLSAKLSEWFEQIIDELGPTLETFKENTID